MYLLKLNVLQNNFLQRDWAEEKKNQSLHTEQKLRRSIRPKLSDIGDRISVGRSDHDVNVNG